MAWKAPIGWPVWWTYALMVPGAALPAIAGFYTALERLRQSARLAGP